MSDMSKIAVLATLRAQPGKLADLVEALRPLLDAVEQEQGTEVYLMHTSDDDPEVVRFYELYSDEEAFKAHGRSETMKAVGGQLAGLLAGRPELVMMRLVGGKGAAT